MFGAPVAYFFEYLLGIRQKPMTAGYRSLVIQPQAVSRFNRMSGSMETPKGKVAVSYEKKDGGVTFCVVIPAGIEAVFRYEDREWVLAEGENRIHIS
jgi:hypothetical protein